MLAIAKLKRGLSDNLFRGPAQAENATTFLSLPAEIRNVIYGYVVQDEVLLLKRTSSKFIPKVPAMLLVSKQVRREYEPLLLSRATIIADVVKYNFKPINATVGKLYSSQLRSLKQNDNLIIRLQAPSARVKGSSEGLRKWLWDRVDSLDRLPWSYAVAVPPDWKMSLQERVNALDSEIGELYQLRTNMSELVQWELDSVIELYRSEERKLSAMLLEPHTPGESRRPLNTYFGFGE